MFRRDDKSDSFDEPLKQDSQIGQVATQRFQYPNASLNQRVVSQSKEGADIKKKAARGSGGARLPLDFRPSPYSVVVGKGKESKNVIGNRRLRVLASNYLAQYAGASDDRQIKTNIVSTLVATIRNACPVGAFIKLGKDDGRWYSVSETVAREKVGYTFRELLGDKYKSSSKAKAAMRSKQRSANPYY